MYLSENKTLRLTTLCGLYVVQGIPWGFVAVALKAWLAGDPHNLSEGQLGDLIAYATLPWSFKWIWGFVVDSYQTSSLGKRRPWLILAQLAMLISLGSIALASDPTGNFKFLLILVLIANICVGLQDVSVDAMAVDLLTDDDRERVSGLMYAANYLGVAIGGAGLGWVIGTYGFQAAVFCQCVLLALSILVPIFIRERPGDRLLPGKVTAAENSNKKQPGNSPAQLLRDVFKAFTLRSTFLGAIVALSVKIGYGIISPSFTTHLRTAAGWSTEYYTSIEGFWGSVAGTGGLRRWCICRSTIRCKACHCGRSDWTGRDVDLYGLATEPAGQSGICDFCFGWTGRNDRPVYGRVVCHLLFNFVAARGCGAVYGIHGNDECVAYDWQ